MKALVFDSSTIISLALNDMLFILKPLKKLFGGEFYITEQIKKELIDKPIGIKRFKFEALMIKKLIDEGVLKIKGDGEIQKEIQTFLNVANNTFKVDDKGIRIIHEGEASCLALYHFLPTENKAIAIDERTTRMLCENPSNLHKLLEKKNHRLIQVNELNYESFKRFNVIRSTELAYIAYKNKIITLPSKQKDAIEAIFYALKYKGCAISHDEIREAKNF